MQNTIYVLAITLVLVSIIAALFIRAFFRAVKVLKEERQGSLLYEIQNHTEPERLRTLYRQYINNLADADYDSLIFRAKEAILRNLSGKTKDQYQRIWKVYQDFIDTVQDPVVKRYLQNVLLQ